MAWPGTRFSIKRCCACVDDPPAGCTIGTDTFDGNLDAFTTTGGPETAGGSLFMSAGDQIVLNAEPTLATDGVHVATTAQTSSGTATLRLFAAREDDDNYVFGVLAIDGVAGTIRVGTRIGGVEEWLSAAVTLRDDTELADAHDLEFCWKPPQTQEPVSGVWFSGTGSAAGIDWINLDQVWSLDGSPATYAFVSAGTSPALRIANLNADGVIPPGSTIDGIETGVVCRDGSESASQIKVKHMQLLDGVGAPVGDIYSDSSFTAFNPSWSTHTLGGPTDDLSAGLTTDDLTDLFGFFVEFENHDPNERQVEVDWAGMTIWFTTPDKTRGRVTLSYTNTEAAADPTTQCAIGLTDYEAPGKGAGIRITAGDWDFTHFTASYLDAPGHTPCPKCECSKVDCGCCSFEDPASQSYIIDLGAGGWNDGDCECDGIAGEYVLEFAGRSLFQAACIWSYSEELDCGGDPGLLSITLALIRPVPGDCIWQLTVVALPPSGSAAFSVARYEGTLEDELCIDNAPFTLIKGIEAHEGDAPCDGTLPATAELDAA